MFCKFDSLEQEDSMLTSSKLASAVAYNFRKAHSVGWPKQYLVASSVLGLSAKEPTAEEFAKLVYDWQTRQKPSLDPDGKLGKNTWKRMLLSPRTSAGTPMAPSWITNTAFNAPKPVGVGPRWLQYAQAEKQEWDRQRGMLTKSQGEKTEFHMSRDEEYFEASPYFGGKVKTRGSKPNNKRRADWCAAFANWCLHASGYSHTGSAGAHSFIVRNLWRFDALKEPKQGCVCVLGDGTKGRHVAFIWRSKNLPINPGGDVKIYGSRKLEILGGNQGQRITVMNERRKMLSCKGHNGVRSPYLWPKRGNPTCDHDPTTEKGHYCGRVHND